MSVPQRLDSPRGRAAAAPRVPAPPPASAPRAAGRGWDPLLIALAIYLLCGVARLHQVFKPLEHAKPLIVSCGCALALYTIDRSITRRLGPVLRARTTRWVLGFLLWAGISTVSALRPGESVSAFAQSLPVTTLMFILVVGAVRDWRDVERLCTVYFFGIAVYAMVVLVRFRITTEQWRLDQLYYYDSNDFATVAVTALPIGLYFLVNRAHRVFRMFAAAGLLCLMVAFVWSGSRGGLLALATVTAFLLVKYRAIHPAWRLGVTGVILAMVVVTASDAYWNKMESMLQPSKDYNMIGPWGRMQVWKRGIGYMLSFPLTGVGYANFPVAEGTLFPLAKEMQSHGKGAKWGVAHNSFIEAGAELGFPGLVLFIGMLGAALGATRSVRRIPGGPQGPPRLAQSLTASLLGFAVGSFFLTLTYSDLVFSLVALAVALAKTTRIARIPRKVAPA